MKYVNEYKYSDEMCRHAAIDVYYRRPYILAMHIILAVVCIGGFAFTIYFLAGGITPKYHYSTYIFYAVAPIAAEIGVFFKFRDMLKKERALLSDDDSKMVLTVDDDKMVERLGEKVVGESTFLDVEKVYESRDFFLVIALSQEYFIFKKGCFTEGDEASFKADMKQKAKSVYQAAIDNGKKK